jgi:clan AA aspartic protease
LGTFRHPIEISDPQGQRTERLEALVDTGASYTVVPASILRRLGVAPADRRTFLLGDGRRVEHEVGETRIGVDGKSLTSLVVFGEEQAGPVLGALALEAFGLAVDLVKRRLVPTDAFLMLAVTY